jgi:hypothetical protein
MEIIKDLENKIKLLTSRMVKSRKQLDEHQEGNIKLSYIAQASSEESIGKNNQLLVQNQDIKKLAKEEKIKIETRKNNYFKYQIQRLKRDKTKSQKEIDDAILIQKGLPVDLKLEDEDIFELSHKSQELHLILHLSLNRELTLIRDEFKQMTEKCINTNNKDLILFNYRIPIIVLQLSVLLNNIKENIKDEKLKDFKGFPKFQDWWIDQLWNSHQAYMSFFKWKRIILGLCISDEQKKAFEFIFKNWLYLKKILNSKQNIAYGYNQAFDELIAKYTNLKEEFVLSNMHSLKTIIESLTENEDFATVSSKHTTLTPYMQFKLKKIENNKK